MSDIKNVYFGGLTAKRGEDGHMRVKGLATDDTLDLDQQICDPTWLAKAMPEWMLIGNIREMHQAKAVGKALEMEQTGTGFAVEAKVVDKEASAKVEEGIYTGFSIGIKNARVVKDAKAPGGRIVDGQIVEVSLVDRPANPSAVIEIAKSVDGVLVKGAAVEKFGSGTEINHDAIMSEVPVTTGDAPRSDHFLPCSSCGGTGHKSNIDAEALTEIRCENCNGSGREPADEPDNYQHYSPSNPALQENENNEIKAVESDLDKGEFHGNQYVDGAGSPHDDSRTSGAAEHAEKGNDHMSRANEHYGAMQNHYERGNNEKAEAHRAAADAHERAATSHFKASNAHDFGRAGAASATTRADADSRVADAASYLAIKNAKAADADVTKSAGEGEAEIVIAEPTAPETPANDDVTSVADDATLPAVSETETTKAATGDDELVTTKAALAEAQENADALKAALDELREMAAPGGPVLRQSTEQSNKSARATALLVEAEHYRSTAAQLSEPIMKNRYLAQAARLEQEANLTN